MPSTDAPAEGDDDGQRRGIRWRHAQKAAVVRDESLPGVEHFETRLRRLPRIPQSLTLPADKFLGGLPLRKVVPTDRSIWLGAQRRQAVRAMEPIQTNFCTQFLIRVPRSSLCISRTRIHEPLVAGLARSGGEESRDGAADADRCHVRGYKANAIPSAPGARPEPDAPSESGAPSPDDASGKAPESRRLDAERRRALLGRIASTASRGELRAIQAEVIAAYLGMAARRVSSETDVEKVRDAARERLRLMGPLAPVMPTSQPVAGSHADEDDERKSAD